MNTTVLTEYQPQIQPRNMACHHSPRGEVVLPLERLAEEPSNANRPKMLRVLVIGNEQDATGHLVDQVHHWGHEAVGENDGLAALRVAAIQHPNVVLLKMKIPSIDGCQIARHLRGDFPRRKCLIVALMGPADGRFRQQWREADIDVLLTHPVELSNLETLLLLELLLINRASNNTGPKSCPCTCNIF